MRDVTNVRLGAYVLRRSCNMSHRPFRRATTFVPRPCPWSAARIVQQRSGIFGQQLGGRGIAGDVEGHGASVAGGDASEVS